MLDGTLLAAIAIALAAGVVSGLAGFGFALVSVTPLLHLYDPPTVVMLTIVLTLMTNWVVVIGAGRFIQRRAVLALLPGAFLGLLIGARLLETLDPALIKLLASGVVLAFTLALLAGVSIRGADSRWAVVVAGASSGILATSTGLSGPPVVMLFAARRFAPHPFRASIAAYLFAIDVVALGILVAQGTVGESHFIVAATLVPPAIVGSAIGRWLVRYVSPAGFRRTTLVLLLLTGVTGVASAISA